MKARKALVTGLFLLTLAGCSSASVDKTFVTAVPPTTPTTAPIPQPTVSISKATGSGPPLAAAVACNQIQPLLQQSRTTFQTLTSYPDGSQSNYQDMNALIASLNGVEAVSPNSVLTPDIVVLTTALAGISSDLMHGVALNNAQPVRDAQAATDRLATSCDY